MITRFILLLLCLLSVTPATAVGITAASWAVADSSGSVIIQKNADQVRSIASITKLVTVMTVIDARQDMTERLGLFTRRQLIDLTLVRSDNKASVTLCQYYPGGTSRCISEMNRKVRTMGLVNTHFVEPTGLSVMNVSTARELISIILAAGNYPEISEAASTKIILIRTHRGVYSYRNTNHEIGIKYKFLVSKTGYINASGWNVAVSIRMAEDLRVVVVLGSRSKDTRVPEAVKLANTSFAAQFSKLQ